MRKDSNIRKLLFLYCVLALSISINAFAEEVEDVPPTILVDSAETLANESGERIYVSYGEWDTNGDYEGWTVNNSASSSVSGGVLTATENVGGKGVVWNFARLNDYKPFQGDYNE